MKNLLNAMINGVVIFLSALPQGVTMALNWAFPAYRSWAGFDGWVKTLVQNLSLTKNQAYIALLHPQEPYDWLLGIDDLLLGELTNVVTPFNGVTFIKEAVIYWADNGGLSLCQAWEVAKYGAVLVYCRPKNSKEFKRCRYLMALGVSTPQNMSLWRDIRGWKRSPEELALFGAFGGIHPKMVEILSMVYGGVYHQDHRNLLQEGEVIYPFLKALNNNSDLLEAIDLRFFEGECTIKDLLQAGVKPTVLLPALTKREASVIAGQLEIYHFPVSEELIAEVYAEEILAGFPLAWRHELRSVPVAKWAMRHLAQLHKTRLIHGPGGAVRTLHYHELLREITPEMLVNGEKTSWRRVMDAVEAVAADRIKAELGENVALPQLKTTGVSGVTPIKTSHALRDEGEVMAHCVGGYVRACLAKTSYIYHVGDPAPQGATAEICPDGKGYKLQQLYGLKDSAPSGSIVAKAQELVRALNK